MSKLSYSWPTNHSQTNFQQWSTIRCSESIRSKLEWPLYPIISQPLPNGIPKLPMMCQQSVLFYNIINEYTLFYLNRCANVKNIYNRIYISFILESNSFDAIILNFYILNSAYFVINNHHKAIKIIIKNTFI